MKFLIWAGMSLSTTQFAPAAAPDYFRLEPGSIRVYRADNRADLLTIQVGQTGFMHNGHVHYHVKGYVNSPVLAYRDEANGALYYFDEDTDTDVLLTVADSNSGTFNAPFRGCNQLGGAIENEPGYRGPAGAYGKALTLLYYTFGCAGDGVIRERYVENLGLVQRMLQTNTGPVTYELVHASIGAVSITEAPNASLALVLRQPDTFRIMADLRWNAVGEGFALVNPSSQEYDVVLRNADGTELWRWSSGKVFIPAAKFRYARQLSYEVEIPLQLNGILLPAGFYTVEAWLNTTPEKQFAAAASFLRVLPEPAAQERRR